jgi:hypothetical protein
VPGKLINYGQTTLSIHLCVLSVSTTRRIFGQCA